MPWYQLLLFAAAWLVGLWLTGTGIKNFFKGKPYKITRQIPQPRLYYKKT